MLNERNEKTKSVIHLLVTARCNRDCPYCCNKQYTIKDIPVVSEEELSECHTVCITGGEPIIFADPNLIASFLKTGYQNIKKIYLYANAYEFYLRLKGGYYPSLMDGYSISIKNGDDIRAFRLMQHGYRHVFANRSNRVYVFDDLLSEKEVGPLFQFIKREWQEDFVPADDSIFRRLRGIGE